MASRLMITPHFSWHEFQRSNEAARLGLNNDIPSQHVCSNVERLCADILEPLRAHFAKPISIWSGYRSPPLNRAIGGSKGSAHCDGRAADIVIPPHEVRKIGDWIAAESGLPFDQVIVEFGRWIHVSVGPKGIAPRRQYLEAYKFERKTKYRLLPVYDSDGKVKVLPGKVNMPSREVR